MGFRVNKIYQQKIPMIMLGNIQQVNSKKIIADHVHVRANQYTHGLTRGNVITFKGTVISYLRKNKKKELNLEVDYGIKLTKLLKIEAGKSKNTRR